MDNKQCLQNTTTDMVHVVLRNNRIDGRLFGLEFISFLSFILLFVCVFHFHFHFIRWNAVRITPALQLLRLVHGHSFQRHKGNHSYAIAWIIDLIYSTIKWIHSDSNWMVFIGYRNTVIWYGLLVLVNWIMINICDG